MLGFDADVEIDLKKLERAFLHLYLHNTSIPRFRGSELSDSDFELLLKSLDAKLKESSPKDDEMYDLSQLPDNQLILFLDFDGVCWVDDTDVPNEKLRRLRKDPQLQMLLETYYWPTLKKYYDCESKDEFLKAACWDPFHMQRIRLLCNEFNARIVVSSSWRHGRSYKHLKNLLSLWGLGEYCVGKTVDGFGCRTTHVKTWLRDNPRFSRFLILDDQYAYNMKSCFPSQFIHCNSEKGFDEETYQKARGSLQIKSEKLDIVQATPCETKKLTVSDILRLKPSTK